MSPSDPVFAHFLTFFLVVPSLNVSSLTLLFQVIFVFLCPHSLQDCGPVPSFLLTIFPLSAYVSLLFIFTAASSCHIPFRSSLSKTISGHLIFRILKHRFRNVCSLLSRFQLVLHVHQPLPQSSFAIAVTMFNLVRSDT